MATLRELIIKVSANSQSFQTEIARASRMGADYYNRHSAPDLGINLPIALTQYLQNDLLVSC